MRFGYREGLVVVVAAMLCGASTGCQDQPVENPSLETATGGDDAHTSHPTEGPHHGDLIELGNEEYHGELLHEDGAVTIYVLDGSAKQSVAIDAAAVTVNVAYDGQAEQFELPARPVDSDPDGRSSRFVSDEPRLAELLDQDGTTARLVLMIEGTQYTGRIEHGGDHDHNHHH